MTTLAPMRLNDTDERDSGQVEIVGTRQLKPTPDILDALEKDYPIEASIADLVDNSIDARAHRVLIRFGMRKGRPVNLCIADNGRGMNDDEIHRAMQFAARRPYGATELGMFGVGMKTASLSQASAVTVCSRAQREAAVGRQWTREGIKKQNWSVNIVSSRSAAGILGREWGSLGRIRIGTVVRWDRVTDFDRLQDNSLAYVEELKVRIQNHLGLKLHRFLEDGRIEIWMDVEDLDSGDVGPPSSVRAMNPFPPARLSGVRGFPREFVATLPKAGKLRLRAHIWRKKSKDEGYKLGGGRVAEHQGFYFYRHDRLIQDGGWCGIIGTNEPHLSLARVEVNIPNALTDYLKVRSNKAGVDVPASFGKSILKATAGNNGSTFQAFIASAKDEYRRRGELKARPMLEPGDGIPADVKLALKKQGIPYIRGAAFSVRWGRVSGGHLLKVNHSEREIVLNRNCRRALLRDSHGGKTDLPLVKTLLFFALESLVSGQRIGTIERLRIEAIRAATRAALKSELRWAESGSR